jgi:hypothetical protein
VPLTGHVLRARSAERRAEALKRKRFLFGALLLPLAPVFWPVAPAAAQGPEWQFTFSSTTPIALPAWLSQDSIRAALGYDEAPDDVVAGFLADLNHDGADDYVLRSSLAVCGSNCEYALLDGRTHRSLGTVGGSVVVVRPTRINGYPVIQTYGHSSADAGYWSTSVFDGQRYVSVSSVYVEGASQGRLFDTLRGVPSWPPSGRRH